MTILQFSKPQALLYLFEHFLVLSTGCFHSKFGAEYVTQFSSIAISTTCHFLLIVVIVTGGQELSKYESWDIYFLNFVFNNRDSFPIIPDANYIIFSEKKYTVALYNKC